MVEYVGADWASGCWVVVEYGDDPWIGTEPSLLNLWQRYRDTAVAILVDIPIGFSEEGKRDCDRAAEEMLSSRRSTVFSVPVEQAVLEREYDQAREENIAGGFNGLGSQSWGLIPRIREMMVFLEEHPKATSIVHESHPEVCFAAFNDRAENDAPLPSKSTDDGLSERLAILKRESPEFGKRVESFVEKRGQNADWHHRIQSGRIDDVVDAAALALTAKVADKREYPTLPEDRDIGSPPVIVYPGHRQRQR